MQKSHNDYYRVDFRFWIFINPYHIAIFYYFFIDKYAKYQTIMERKRTVSDMNKNFINF